MSVMTFSSHFPRLFLIACWVSAGLLLGAGFLHPALWWVSLGGLIATLWLLHTPHRYWRTFLLGTMAGTIKTGLALIWFWSVYPIDWIGVPDRFMQVFTISAVWSTVSLSIGLGFGFFCAVVCFGLYKKRLLTLFCIPLLLVASELLGSLLFSLYSFGPGSVPIVSFRLCSFGYTLAQPGVFSLGAFFGGVYVLSLLAGIIAVGLVVALRTKPRNYFLISAAVLMALYFVPQSYFHTEPTTRVVAINTAFPLQATITEDQRTARDYVFVKAFTAALVSNSEVIVFPEASHALRSLGSPTDVFSFVNVVTTSTPAIIDSQEITEPGTGRHIVEADIYDSRAGVLAHARKKYLVPSGEFLPYNMARAMKLFGYSEAVDVLEKKMRLASASAKEQEVLSPSLPGVLFCSESVSPLGMRSAARGVNVPVIVHPVSHAWFHSPDILWYQLDLMLRAQVRFVGIPLVQASNMSPPRAYSKYGLPVEGKIIFTDERAVAVQYEL